MTKREIYQAHSDLHDERVRIGEIADLKTDDFHLERIASGTESDINDKDCSAFWWKVTLELRRESKTHDKLTEIVKEY